MQWKVREKVVYALAYLIYVEMEAEVQVQAEGYEGEHLGEWYRSFRAFAAGREEHRQRGLRRSTA